MFKLKPQSFPKQLYLNYREEIFGYSFTSTTKAEVGFSFLFDKALLFDSDLALWDLN